MTNIEAEIEDSQRAIEKVMACKRKIDFKLKQKSSGSGDNHSESYSSAGQVPTRTSQAKAKLPAEINFAQISRIIHKMEHFLRQFSTQKFLKWINSIISTQC